MQIHFDRETLVVPDSWHKEFQRFEMPPTEAEEKEFYGFFLDQTSRLMNKHLEKMRKTYREMRLAL
ncbi:MAG: hypothetical protein SP1CHLAM54_05800 [Chlamydiia bacterium]|nr:hypothetical protein [Chlamydiia bacterium]MCH9615490.1 hypothetical protein [Chlamydiia bacterium]MCH9629145.1 hypothetical protein [Chlamydiia bacterium]